MAAWWMGSTCYHLFTTSRLQTDRSPVVAIQPKSKLTVVIYPKPERHNKYSRHFYIAFIIIVCVSRPFWLLVLLSYVLLFLFTVVFFFFGVCRTESIVSPCVALQTYAIKLSMFCPIVYDKMKEEYKKNSRTEFCVFLLLWNTLITMINS